jgi:tetratricopeptide (TPR) repeat protein
MLEQAGAALASGQYGAAAMLARDGLEQTGLEDLVRCRLLVIQGLSAQAQGLSDDALVAFTRALQGSVLPGEERARALFARGLSLDGAGRLKEAVGDYSAALAVAPGAAYALNNRANVFRRQGQLALAKRDYAAALALNTPNPQYPYYGLGQIAEAEGDMPTARNFYSRAVTADPTFQLALERLRMLGPPDEGGASQPAETIVLRPPQAREREAPVILQPPRTQQAAVPALTPPRPSPIQPVVSPPASPPGRGAPLRPAIVEGAHGAPAQVGARAQAGAMVQLGAWRSEAEAREGWAVAQSMAADILGELSPLIVRAVLPSRGVYYRLRIATSAPVSQFCAVLMQKGLACIPARD